MENRIIINLRKGCPSRSVPQFQYNYGQIVKFIGATLPENYEVHFANSKSGESLRMLGAGDEVPVPSVLFESGMSIFVWVYAHYTGQDGVTIYEATIPIIKRAKPADFDPPPEEKDIIDQLIALMEKTITDSAESAESAATSAEAAQDWALDAEAWAVGQRNGTPVDSEDQTYQNNSKYYAELIGEKADEVLNAVPKWVKDYNVQGKVGGVILNFVSDAFLKNKATGDYSTAQGYQTMATGYASHAEGGMTKATGTQSHAEGSSTRASNVNSHAEGYQTTASGKSSHAQGQNTTASGDYSHAEGWGIEYTGAFGRSSHVEGYHTTASGEFSHAEGKETIANHESQHVFGAYNIEDPSTAEAKKRGNYVEIVGNGTTSILRSNARTLDWNGNEVLAGKLTMGTGPTNNMDAATKQYVDNSISSLGEIFTLKGSVASVEELNALTNMQVGDVYIVQSDSSEYVYTIEDEWEQLGPIMNPGSDKMPIVSYDTETLIFDTTTVSFSKDGDNDWYISTKNPIPNFTSKDFTYNKIYTVTWDGIEYQGLFTRNESAFFDNGYQYEWGKIGYIKPLGYDDEEEALPFCIEYDLKQNEGEIHFISYDTENSHTIKMTSHSFQKTIVDPLLYAPSSRGHVPVRPGSGTMSVLEGGAQASTEWYSHAEGASTISSGNASHAEGGGTVASENYAHAEGMRTTASGKRSHAQGTRTIASGITSHAEGSWTTASGGESHTEGQSTTASGDMSHAEGNRTVASGGGSHAEGQDVIASGNLSHAEGDSTIANHRTQHVFGAYNIADPSSAAANERGTYVEIVGNGTADDARSNVRTLDWNGNETLAGKLTIGVGPTNNMDVATKQYADTTATAAENAAKAYTDAELADFVPLKWTVDFDGNYQDSIQATIQNDITNNIASGRYSHAEGSHTTASNFNSHAEGSYTIASGENSHAEGFGTNGLGMGDTGAFGNESHTEGFFTTASGWASHAEGYQTIANHLAQHVFGQYNAADPSTQIANGRGNYVEIVGNGAGTNARSNARTLDWDGNEVLAGKLTVGANPTNAMDVATKQYVDSYNIYPDPPTTNGDYILQATVTNGTPTYAWIEVNTWLGGSY